ncbi:MAG: membrane protein insertion efficiency factor YidD [Candidatus Riflebacteria bacterium]|nr:membrane protein insertion efficiency factor YidD [Candidatus Riflebacteria bacterium]
MILIYPLFRKIFSLPARTSLILIRLYQKTFSPVLGDICRFHPSCSRYTHEAITRYGFVKGWALGLYRIFRCNPFNPGGDDPVP